MASTFGSSTGLRIGVVGGSISGCAAAVALGRLGHRVRVFERDLERLLVVRGRAGDVDGFTIADTGEAARK